MATNTERVSIIIPAYNYGRYLADCLDSVLKQSFKDWECIIVDNGSTDNTKEVAQAYTSKDHRFIYHHIEQKGVSFARNYGIEKSKGSYILPLDADDKIGSTYLEEAVKILSQRKDIKVVYCEAELFGAMSGKWNLSEYSWKGLLRENCIFCTALFRRSDFDKTGGFNENMREGFEDWDFWINMLGNGGEVYRIPKVLFYYRMRTDSRNGALDLEKQLRLRKQIFENNRKHYEEAFSIPELLFENYLLNLEKQSFLGSKDFKTGKSILTPLRSIRNLFKPRK